MSRYVLGYDDLQVIGQSWGTLWERPIIDKLLRNRLPDHVQDHLPLSDCCIGTLEWTPDNVEEDARKSTLEKKQILWDRYCRATTYDHPLELSDQARKGR